MDSAYDPKPVAPGGGEAERGARETPRESVIPTTMTDDDMTLLEEAAHRAEHIEAELADEYKATAVDVDRHAHDEDSRLSITLAFCGFANFETAREKVSRVARDLADRDDIDNVSMSVDNYGAAGWIASEYHEDDDRPSGTVRATVPAEDA